MARAAVNPDTGVTIQQEAFALEYVRNGGNGSAAYRKSYNTEDCKPATVNRKAKELLDNGKIAARIKFHHAIVTQRAVENAVVDKTYVLVRLKTIAERCMQSAPVFDRTGNPVMGMDDEGKIGVLYAFDGKTATRALELLGKTEDVNLFVDRKETGRPGDFDKLRSMDKDELRRRAQEKAVRLGLGKVVKFTGGDGGKKRAA